MEEHVISAELFVKFIKLMECEEFEVEMESRNFGSIIRQYRIEDDTLKINRNTCDPKYKLIVWDTILNMRAILNLKEVKLIRIGGMELDKDDLSTFSSNMRDDLENLVDDTKVENKYREVIATAKSNVNNDYGRGI